MGRKSALIYNKEGLIDMKDKVIESIKRERLIIIVRGMSRDELLPLSDALYDGGVRLMEITYTAGSEGLDTEVAETIRLLSERMEGKMYVGAGTVTRVSQVELTAKAGGKFIISPDANPDIIRYSRELGLVSIPGVMTPTEINSAYEAGADFVKLFPVTSLGAEYVKAIRAPLTHIPMLAVGGVNLDNMADYAKAGVSGFGVGASFCPKELLAARDYPRISEFVNGYIREIQKCFDGK